MSQVFVQPQALFLVEQTGTISFSRMLVVVRKKALFSRALANGVQVVVMRASPERFCSETHVPQCPVIALLITAPNSEEINSQNLYRTVQHLGDVRGNA